MKRIVVNILVFLLLGLFLLLSADKIAEGFKDSFKEDLAKDGIKLSVQTAETDFPLNLRYTNTALVFPFGYILVPLNLDKVSIQPYPSLLFFGKTSLDIAINAYSGTIDTSIRTSIFNDINKINLEVNNLNLGNHILLQNFGIKGIMTLKGKGELHQHLTGSTSLPEVRNANIEFSLRDAFVKNNKLFNGQIIIPQIKNINLETKITIDSNNLEFEDISYQSSLGSAQGKGNLSYRFNTHTITGIGKININLTDEGLATLGPLFSKYSTSKANTTEKLWVLKWKKSSLNSKTTVILRPRHNIKHIN